jgi:hypothetical protein
MASSSHVSPSDAAADTGSHSEVAQKDSPVSLLQDVLNKVEASLMVNVETHTQNQEYSYRKDGLDFLDTKNSLLLSYMIDLVYRQRSKLMRLSTDDSEMGADEATAADEDSNYQRLLEMKTILDKSSGLDRKLRYQLDKILLQASSHRSDAGAFATPQSNDPLQFRPAMALDDENDAGSSSDDDHDDDEGDKSHDVDDDDDLAAARQTMFLARQKKKGAAKNAEVGDDAVYRAPRLVAAPYPMDHSAGEEALSRRMERSEQRLRQKLRASEMVQTMKQQLGDRDQPDQEDTTGGTAMGTQSDASRRFLQQQKERTKYEEEFMIRFTTTKQEKKEQRRLMREEQSNLSSLSDLNNLVRDSSLLHRQSEQKKRKTDDTPRTPKRSTPKNALQAELFGGASGESRRKKKSHR